MFKKKTRHVDVQIAERQLALCLLGRNGSLGRIGHPPPPQPQKTEGNKHV